MTNRERYDVTGLVFSFLVRQVPFLVFLALSTFDNQAIMLWIVLGKECVAFTAHFDRHACFLFWDCCASFSACRTTAPSPAQ